VISSLTADEFSVIREACPRFATTPDWLIEIAWRTFSEARWAAGCVIPDAEIIASFAHWMSEREAPQ